jgi:xanthine dehydrogenase FAD-binding subunit
VYNVTNYYEAETVQEAADILAQKPDLKIIAGGTDVLVRMRSGKIEETGLLSIRKIRELQKIEICKDDTISIGSLVTFSQLALDSIINKNIAVLTEAANSMGGPQIRNVATIGGNICNGVTSADSASTLLALNALLKIQCKYGERVVPLADFYLGPGKVDLKPDELLTHITIAPQI